MIKVIHTLDTKGKGLDSVIDEHGFEWDVIHNDLDCALIERKDENDNTKFIGGLFKKSQMIIDTEPKFYTPCVFGKLNGQWIELTPTSLNQVG